MKPAAKTCNKEVQKFTNTSYDILLELYNNTQFFKDLWEAINPAYWLDFSSGLGDWYNTSTALIPTPTHTLSIGGGFANDNLDIDCETNKYISLIFETDQIQGNISLIVTYDHGVVEYPNIVGFVTGSNGTLINLSDKPEHTGKITSIRFQIGSNIFQEYKLFKVIVGKPLVTINNLVILESKLTSVTQRVLALENLINNINSRIDGLTENPVLVIDEASLEEDVLKYDVRGVTINGTTKKLIFKNDHIELINSDNSSYFKYNFADSAYEFKGILVLPDGTRITSEDDIRARDGEDADYQEFRFARSVNAPALTNTDPNPTNWTVGVPTNPGFLWMITARKKTPTELVTTWSDPVRLTGENGQNGSNGSDGIGQDGITVALTSESFVIYTDSEGNNPNFAAANGTFMLYRGANRITTGINFTGNATKNNLTMTINATTGDYVLSGGAWNSNTEFFDLNAIFEGVTYTKRVTIAKARSGGGGQAGSGFFFATINSNMQTGGTLQTTLNNTVLTQAARNPVLGDVIFVSWNNAAQGYSFNGSVWNTSNTTINGDLIASGTIAGDRLVANALYGRRQVLSSNNHAWITDPTGTELPGNMLVWYGSTLFSVLERTALNALFGIDNGGNVYMRNALVQGRLITSDNSGIRVDVGNDGTYLIWAGSGTKNDANGIFWIKTNGTGFIKGEFFQGQLLETKTSTNTGNTINPINTSISHNSAGKTKNINMSARLRLTMQGNTSSINQRNRLTLNKNGVSINQIEATAQGIYDSELNRTDYFVTLSDLFIDSATDTALITYQVVLSSLSGPTGTIVSADSRVTVSSSENKTQA